MNVSHTQTETVAASTYAPVRVVIVEIDGSVRVEDLTPTESGSLLADLQSAVGGLIDVAGLAPGLDMYVHDEGIYVCEPNPVATMVAMMVGVRRQPFFGPAVFTGGVDEDGYDTSISDKTADSIKATAYWLTGQPDLMERMSQRALAAVGR